MSSLLVLDTVVKSIVVVFHISRSLVAIMKRDINGKTKQSSMYMTRARRAALRAAEIEDTHQKVFELVLSNDFLYWDEAMKWGGVNKAAFVIWNQYKEKLLEPLLREPIAAVCSEPWPTNPSR